jgi:hypothetical protein
MNTAAAFMLAILPFLDVVTKVTIGTALSTGANGRNCLVSHDGMTLLFQLLNRGHACTERSFTRNPSCRNDKRPVRGTRRSTGTRGIYAFYVNVLRSLAP